MHYITLDARRLNDRAEAHRYLAEMLDLPAYYGNNLDALADCLSEFGADTHVTLLFADALYGYGLGVREVLEEAAAQPHAFFLTVHE